MAQIGSFALLLALALAAYSFIVGMIALFFQSGHESEGMGHQSMDRVGETARRRSCLLATHRRLLKRYRSPGSFWPADPE